MLVDNHEVENKEPSLKKIEFLIGSPRMKGNTHLMAGMLEGGLNKDNFTSNIKHLYDYDINPCVDCRGCKKDKMVCILKDQMQDIYPCLEDADIIIIGTPIYWYSPSATMKLLLDRMRPYYANKKLAGKSLALLLPAGSGASDCDLTIELFKRFADALELKYIGAAAAQAYDIGEVNNDQEAKASIEELVKYINGAV